MFEKFEKDLREKGLQVTAQRLAVMEAVSINPHSSSEQILRTVKQQIGSISKQAVYDALEALSSNDLIRKIQPAGFPAIYEDRVGDNHHHAICRKCGRTTDIDCAVGSAPCLEIAKSTGFKVDEAEVVFWGHCKDCS